MPNVFSGGAERDCLAPSAVPGCGFGEAG